MAGIEDQNVRCCFCGHWLPAQDAVQLTITTKEMGDESQVIFAHKSCLVKRVHPSIPLHPDLLE